MPVFSIIPGGQSSILCPLMRSSSADSSHFNRTPPAAEVPVPPPDCAADLARFFRDRAPRRSTASFSLGAERVFPLERLVAEEDWPCAATETRAPPEESCVLVMSVHAQNTARKKPPLPFAGNEVLTLRTFLCKNALQQSQPHSIPARTFLQGFLRPEILANERPAGMNGIVHPIFAITSAASAMSRSA